MRTKIIIGLVVFVCLLLGIIYMRSTPQYSLYKAYQAAKTHDYPTFSKYVDVDSVATHAVANVINTAEREVEERIGGSWFKRFRLRIGNSLMQAMGPRLQELAKDWIRDEVVSGNIMETTFKDVNLFVIFTQTQVTIKGNEAELLVNVKEKPVHFKMRQMDDYWQVYEMDIDPSLLRSLIIRSR